MAKLKNSTPKQGQSLHVFIATGGKPKAYKGTKGIENAKGTKGK